MSGKYVLGFDVGGTNVRGALTDAEGNIAARAKAPMPEPPTPENTAAQMAKLAAKCFQEAGLEQGAVCCAGIGSPGPLNTKTGCIIHTPNLPWTDAPLAPLLEERLGVPTYLEGDANAAGWGEYWKGAGRDVRSLILFTLGTGVGGCVILDGRLLRGPDDTGGHLGHIVVPEGGRCGCGAFGCLESVASATATAQRARDAAERGLGLLAEIPPEKITARDVSAAAEKGCPTAREILAEAGRALGRVAAGMANVLNPELCVVGGGMTGAGEFILEPLRLELRRCALPAPGRRLRTVPAELGDDAGVIGAAGLALDRFQEKRRK